MLSINIKQKSHRKCHDMFFSRRRIEYESTHNTWDVMTRQMDRCDDIDKKAISCAILSHRKFTVLDFNETSDNRECCYDYCH